MIRKFFTSLKNIVKDGWLLHIVLPILFAFIVFLFHPYRETFQMDTDEGINLIKAVLVMEGHQITGDIDSDQPPLLSNLLAWVFQWTGQSVNIARFIILLFSSLLLSAAGIASQIAWDRSTSILVYFMLISLPNFLEVSVSVMIGQPSIALAMVAMLCIFLWHKKHKWPWLALCGLFMSLSLFTKIFTAILIPIFGAGLLFSEWVIWDGQSIKLQQKSWKQILRPAFIFSVSLLLFIIILAVATLDLKNILSLIMPHLEYRELSSVMGSITDDLKPATLVIMLAVVGLGYSLVKRHWLALYPAVWATIAYLFLLNHNPIWWHHQMLITIPAALLAAFGSISIVRDFWAYDKTPNRWKMVLIFSGLLIIGALLNQQFPRVLEPLSERVPSLRSQGLDPGSGDMRMLNKMQSVAEEGALMVTDMPMFAVRGKMRIPTELAWVSDKRFRTGFLAEQDFIDIIETEKPTFVLIARYPLHDVRAYMEENPNYKELLSTKIHTDRKADLYYRITP